MTPQDKLKELEDTFNKIGRINYYKDHEWLILRVKQLEAALEFYTFENSWIGGGVEGKDGYNDMQGSHAKKILNTMPSEEK